MVKSNHHYYGHGKTWFRGDIIGKGSSGSVYLAISKKPKRRVNQLLPVTMAVKSAKVSASSNLQTEKMVLDNLRGCPYIRACYCEEITTAESGESMIYNLLLEYGAGGTLYDLIKKSGGCGLPEKDVGVYTRSILLGIYHTHLHGYVHRDLEPKNILLFPSTSNENTSSGYMVKIGDYGYAKKVNCTRRKTIMEPYLRGKLKYMSPEAVVYKVQEQPSDIWALGCIVVEMLTGKSLWEGRNESQIKNVLHDICTGKRLLPVMMNTSGISKEARDFLKGCFVASDEERATVQKLLSHPFVGGMKNVDAVEKSNDFKMDGLIPKSIYRADSTSSLSSVVFAGA